MKRFLLTTLLVAGLVVPHLSHAAIDQKCWVRADCEARRKTLADDTMTDAEIKDGFIQDNQTEKACGGLKWGKNDVGFCLPAGQAQTKISFGGETKFENIGTFIKSMYKYTIWVASILAAAMLIVAGFQWAASGGGSDAINSAKNKIAGAISGLILLALSYVILNTVNPYLVNFRLPQIWLVNDQGFANYCSILDENDGVKEVGTSEEKISEAVKTEIFKAGVFPTKPKEAVCGKQYVFSSGGGQSCKGSFCNNGNVCLLGLNDKAESCWEGQIGGIISNSAIGDTAVNNADSWTADVLAGLVMSFWEFPWVPDTGLDSVRILRVCQDGTMDDVEETSRLSSNATTAKQLYTISVTEEALNAGIAECGGNFKGFALRLDFNNPNDPVEDEAHVIGRSASGNAIDLGDMGTFRHLGHYDYSLPVPINKVASPEFYMTKEQILKGGIVLNIDAGTICTVYDGEKKRKKCYDKWK